MIRNLNAEIRRETLETLMNDIPQPVIKLNTSEVCEGQDVLETFYCIICHNLPISPFECNKCDVIFCENCIKDFR